MPFRLISDDSTSTLQPRTGELKLSQSQGTCCDIVEAAQTDLLVLDLRRVTWVQPGGMAFIWCVLHQLHAQAGCSIHLRVPESDDVTMYLARMEFLTRIEALDFVKLVGPVPRPNRWDRQDRLLEFQTVEVRDDDEVHERTGQLMHVLRNRRELDDPESLFYLFSEILSNVHVHSGEGQGIVAAQTYKDRLEIVFADCGIGIPGALRRGRFEGNDPALLEKAFEQGVSTRVGRGGMGLPGVGAAIDTSGNRLMIRSGNGILFRRRNANVRASLAQMRLGGTIVASTW